MRIAILGARGQIGQYIHKRLLDDYPDAEIISCSRKKSDGYFQFDPFKDDWSITGKLDVIINCIGIIKETTEADFKKAHIGLAKLIVKNHFITGRPKIIHVSVLNADRDSQEEFFKTKGVADSILIENGNAIIVRPSIVCTPGTMMVKKLRMLKKLSKISLGYVLLPSEVIKTKIQPIVGDELAAMISRLCTDRMTGIIETGGPEQMTISGLMRDFLGLKIIPLNQKLADVLIPLVSGIFPRLISKGEYALLKKNNVVSDKSRIALTGILSTGTFWKEELADDVD